MTDHLPECKALDVMPEATTMFHSTSRQWFWEHGCICDRLRACEQRVLDAAREAVAGLKRHVEFPGAPVNYIHPDFFLAAIDALREKP